MDYMNMNGMSNYNYGYNPYQRYVQNQPKLIGRVVNSFNDIMANDVPMDGSPATFILPDYSQVAVKQWNANGTIDTRLYAPLNVPETTQKAETDTYAEINDRLARIEDNLLKMANTKKPIKKTEGVDID